MKKVLVLVTLVATASAYSQGLINFNNKISSVNLNAPISYAAGGPATAGPIASNATIHVMSGTADFNGTFARAALYGGPANATEDQLVLITPIAGFRAPASINGYFNPGSPASRVVTGIAAGSPGVFQVRAWDTGSLTGSDSEASARQQAQYYWGRSVLINIAQLGGDTPSGVVPTPNLGANTGIAGEWGLLPFSITYVPEPSIIGLGILGAITGLFVFRRRN